MKHDIIEKLRVFINKKYPFNEECEVLYLMVEFRKLIEIENTSEKFPLIKFYSDWMVHSRKDVITPDIKKIMLDIDTKLDPYPKDFDISFLYMPELKEEIRNFLNKYNLRFDHFIDDNEWKAFAYILGLILTDQPLIDPAPKIKKFSYLVGKNKTFFATVDFKDHRGSIDLGEVIS